MHPNVHCNNIYKVKTQKQPKCPPTDEWIKKMWYIYTMECCSAMKNDETASFAATQMNLEIIIANEVIERQVSYDITYMWNLKYNTDELI